MTAATARKSSEDMASSTYDDIKKFIPIRRLKPTQAHCQAFYFLDYFINILAVKQLLLIRLQIYNYYALFYQIIEVVVVAMALSAIVIQHFQFLELLALLQLLIIHVWVEVGADLFVVVLQTLQD